MNAAKSSTLAKISRGLGVIGRFMFFLREKIIEKREEWGNKVEVFFIAQR